MGVLDGVKAKLDRADALITDIRARVVQIARSTTWRGNSSYSTARSPTRTQHFRSSRIVGQSRSNRGSRTKRHSPRRRTRSLSRGSLTVTTR